MNLLLVNNLYSPNMVGGAERSVQGLAEALVRLGHRVSVACLDRQVSRKHINGVHIHYVSLANVHWPFGEEHSAASKVVFHALDIRNEAMAEEIGKIIDTERADIVHTNNLSGFSVAVWKQAEERRIPIVHTLRDMYLLCVRSSMFRHGKSCGQQCFSCQLFSGPKVRATRSVRHVVGISRFILESHLKRGCFPNASSAVIHNGYQSLSVPPSEQRTGPLRIGFLGRLTPAKGIQLLVETFISSPVCKRASLLIAGEGHGAFVANLREQIAGSSARLVGHMSPNSFFAEIDVLVVPSIWDEPLGRVVIEANAHGVPAIVSRRGGLPEIVEHGVTGYVFDPEDVGSLRDLLEHLIERPADLSQMRKVCRGKSSEYLPERVARAYASIYARALAADGV